MGAARGFGGRFGNLLSDVENKPLTLIDGQAEYLGGHADNTLTGIVDYMIDDV